MSSHSEAMENWRRIKKISRLKFETKQLKQEKQMLKEATVFLAKETQ